MGALGCYSQAGRECSCPAVVIAVVSLVVVKPLVSVVPDVVVVAVIVVVAVVAAASTDAADLDSLDRVADLVVPAAAASAAVARYFQ
jgi:hypothetical protein